MSRSRGIAVLAAAAALLLGIAGPSWAKPTLQEDFRGPQPGLKGKGAIVQTKDGYGYQGPGGDDDKKASFIEYSLKGRGFNPVAGTVELDLTRAEKDQHETLVSFVDAAGERLVVFEVSWEGVDPQNPDATSFCVENFAENLSQVFSRSETDMHVATTVPCAYLKKNIPRGRTVHVALTWGRAGVLIYVDGALVPALSADPLKMARALSRANKFIVGATLSSSENPGGAWVMSSSLITNVQLHDKQLLTAEFDQAIVPDLPAITALGHDVFKAAGFSGKLVAGNSLRVTMSGSPGATATFDVAYLTGLDGKMSLDWRGYGVYLEEKVFYEKDEINLRDVTAYLVYASKSPIDTAAPGIEPLQRLDVQNQSYLADSLAPETPYYFAVLAEMRDGSFRTVLTNPTGLPMAEISPGIYSGMYAVGGWDRFPDAVVVGRLSRGAVSSSLVDAKKFTVDPSYNLSLTASATELKADEKSTSTITVVMTNANGDPVAGRKIKFLLATTSQYTGVVGGGAFAQQVGGNIDAGRWGETDLFGKLTATYVAGFAAKTAVIVARDLAGNSTGVCYVKTYITATAQLQLEPLPDNQADTADYQIMVTSSDEWLTADGSSRARITARVTRAGAPVKDHKIAFAVANSLGSIKAVDDITDKNGEARAVYTAGKKIGIALITATDTVVGITGSVQIELRSDAPAKIAIKLTPEKLPADGRSRADLLVTVTDINDNPNDNAEVEYRISEGSGKLRDDKGLTNRNGESTNDYIAGRTPGRVSIEITVRSAVPTDAELLAARGLALAVTDFKFF